MLPHLVGEVAVFRNLGAAHTLWHRSHLLWIFLLQSLPGTTRRIIESFRQFFKNIGDLASKLHQFDFHTWFATGNLVRLYSELLNPLIQPWHS